MTDPIIIDEAKQLISEHKTIQLASVSAQGKPHISYAPYAIHTDGYLYIFISHLAEHHATIHRGTVCAMIINSEENSKNLFARRRISFDCSVSVIEPTSLLYAEALATFTQAQGKIVDLLRTLNDFDLIQLRPKTALLVKGFGDAHKLDEDLPRLFSKK